MKRKYDAEVDKLCSIADWFFYNQEVEAEDEVKVKTSKKINITSKSIKKAAKVTKKRSKWFFFPFRFLIVLLEVI